MSARTPTGFIDLQVNGYLGRGFTGRGLTIDDVRHVTTELLRRGTIAYCPTICTTELAAYDENLPVLAKAMAESDLRGHVLGVHLEGPFLSPVSRGAHPEKYLRLPDIRLFDRWMKLAKGRIAILTLAPELDGAEALIRHAANEGVLVALGHNMTDDTSLERAVEAGAGLCTHLGNGIPQMIPRHPNPIISQLTNDEIPASFITDGHHLPKSFIRLALRAKPLDKFIVISDSVNEAGMPPGRYGTGDDEVIVEENGRIVLANGWSLAGSSACMLDCMNYLGDMGILDEKALWRTGYNNPLKLLGSPAIAKNPCGTVKAQTRNGKVQFTMTA